MVAACLPVAACLAPFPPAEVLLQSVPFKRGAQVMASAPSTVAAARDKGHCARAFSCLRSHGSSSWASYAADGPCQPSRHCLPRRRCWHSPSGSLAAAGPRLYAGSACVTQSVSQWRPTLGDDKEQKQNAFAERRTHRCNVSLATPVISGRRPFDCEANNRLAANEDQAQWPAHFPVRLRHALLGRQPAELLCIAQH